MIGQALGSALGGAMTREGSVGKAPENLIPDAFYDPVPVQQPGAQVAADPSRTSAPTSGEAAAMMVEASPVVAGEIVVTAPKPPGFTVAGYTYDPAELEMRWLGVFARQANIDPDGTKYDWGPIFGGLEANAELIRRNNYLVATLAMDIPGLPSVPDQTRSNEVRSGFGQQQSNLQFRVMEAQASGTRAAASYLAAPSGVRMNQAWEIAAMEGTLGMASLQYAQARNPELYRGYERDVSNLEAGLTIFSAVSAVSSLKVMARTGGVASAAKGTPSLEAAYQARYASAYERGVVFVDGEIAAGRMAPAAGQPPHLYRAGRIDAFAREDLKLYAEMQGHGSDIVRINQRLYLNGDSGAYRVPDLYFPQSRTIFDGTLGTKTLNTPQIKDFRTATGNAPVGIVRPEGYGGFYWLTK